MPEHQKYPVIITGTGEKGFVFRRARFLDRSEENRIVLDSGREIRVPSDALEIAPDGTFTVAGSYGSDADAVTTAVSAEERNPETVTVTSATMVSGSRDEVIVAAPNRPDAAEKGRVVDLDQQLFSEDVSIERVPVNRLVNEIPETRSEGDVMIIPVVEEVVTVQKRLLLKEEVRVHRRRTESRQARQIVVDGDEMRIIGSDGREIRT